MKKFLTILLVVILFVSCSDREEPNNLVNNHLIAYSESSLATKELLKLGLMAYPAYAKYASLPQSDVRLIRVSYLTEYPAGNKITASGVFAISDNYRSDFPTVVYNHGTIYRNEAPSLSIAGLTNYTSEVMLCTVMASAFNCAVLIPDYIGYGDSETILHPYIHTSSLGQASFDLIQAFREYAAAPEVDLAFNNKIFITGYSEGGNAAIALQKKINETPSNGLQVLKTIAGSGAYDNVSFARAFFGQNSELDRHMVSVYLWAIGMYKTDFAYSKNYEQIFSTQDNALLKSINYNMGYFAAESLAINTNPALLFHPEFRESVLNGTNTEFLELLKNNSLLDFTPTDSLILVYGTADTFVYPENTVNTYQAMLAKGCKVKLYTHDKGDHYTTLPTYLEIVLGRLMAERR